MFVKKDDYLHYLLNEQTSFITYYSLRRGSTGPSSLAPATKDKTHPFLIIQWSQGFSSQDFKSGILVGTSPEDHYKLILCKFGQICATGNDLMQLKTILCKFGQICATGRTPM